METVVSLSVALLGIPFVTAAKSGSSATDNSKTASKSGFNLGEMDAVDYLRSGALVVAFLATAFHGKATWMKADTFMLAAFGSIWYFFPKPLLEYQMVGKVDVIHMYMAHVFGALALGTLVTSYAASRSRNDGVHTAQFLARTIGGSVAIQAGLFDYNLALGSPQRFAPTFLTFGVLGQVLWVLGNLVYTIRSSSFGGGRINLKDRLTQHLLFDCMFFCIASLGNYGFPGEMLSTIEMKGFKPDPVHVSIMHHVGALLFASGIYSLCAMSFDDDEDKKAVLLGRLVTYGMFYPMLALYQWQYTLTSHKMLTIGISMTMLPVCNALCGYFNFKCSWCHRMLGGDGKSKAKQN